MKSLVRISLGTILLVALMAFSLPGVNRSSSQKDATDQKATSADQKTSEAQQPSPPYFKSEKAAEPLPSTLPPLKFAGRPVVVAAYTIARKIPKVLAQQPCFCGCDEHFKHRSLLDCYTSDHTAGCGVCVKETFLTWEMARQHRTPAQIRAAILRGDWKNVDLNHPPEVKP
jgi:uncharacterized protein with PCYCGC motif